MACEIIPINSFQMATAGMAGTQRKCQMKVKVDEITGYASVHRSVSATFRLSSQEI